MFLANFVKIDMVKLKENRELGVLTPGIKRDGHQKNPGNQEIRNQKFRELEGTTVNGSELKR